MVASLDGLVGLQQEALFVVPPLQCYVGEEHQVTGPVRRKVVRYHCYTA
jgi:hypothetical protein